MSMTDTERIDWLETFVNREGGIVLHDGKGEKLPYPGLGLRPGFISRTLREAIDECSGSRR